MEQEKGQAILQERGEKNNFIGKAAPVFTAQPGQEENYTNAKKALKNHIKFIEEKRKIFGSIPINF